MPEVMIALFHVISQTETGVTDCTMLSFKPVFLHVIGSCYSQQLTVRKLVKPLIECSCEGLSQGLVLLAHIANNFNLHYKMLCGVNRLRFV